MQRSTRLVTGLVTAALASGGALTAASPSQAAGPAAAASAVKAPVDCPTAYPDAKIVNGLKGTGFTVSSGTKPQPFAVTVLGKLNDFPEPGAYLVIARIASPAVSQAHGDWAGISGSPVYAADGRLIGSDSYSFGINSDIVGLTPGSALLPVLNGVPGAAATARRALGTAARSTLTQAQKRDALSAGVPAAAADAGVTRNPLVLSGSGRVTKKLLDALMAIPGTRYVGTSGTASGAPVKASAVHAGGNFVAAVSYGEVSFYAAGTTTVVCKGKAVAFGHPFLWNGPTSLTAHTASTVVVQPDSLFGAYKLVNPGGVIGIVDADLTNGIRATLGAKPKAVTAVTTAFTLGKKTVKGTSTVSGADYAALVAASQTQTDLVKAFGYEGKGSATATLTVKGVRANGKAFSFTRKDVYSDPSDLPYAVADAVYQFTKPLVTQEFENLRITSISVTASASASVQRYSVSKVQANEGGSWVALGSGPVPATPGGTLPLRVTLTPYKGVGATKVLSLTLKVPAGATAPLGLVVSAGHPDVDVSNASSVTQLLRLLAAVPPNDSVRAALITPGPNGDQTVAAASARVGTAVANYENLFDVSLPGGAAPLR